MSDRFDQIFALERLRRHWQPDEPKVSAAPSADATAGLAQQITGELNRLSTLIEHRFPKKEAKGLGILLDDLSNLLAARFQTASGQDTVADDDHPDAAAIIEILNQMEDLIETLSLYRL